MSRRRLDVELVGRGLVPSRELARELILAGRVTVGGAPAPKPARLVSRAEPVEILGPPPKFVGRAGQKLEGALDLFTIAVAGRAALDVGSSTGGFTDCLLQRGASSVVAVDVGTNQLHERLRNDDRVVSREQTDIRHFSPTDLHFHPDHHDRERFDLIVSDLSFISTRSLLPTLAPLLNPTGDLVVLIKPQFEAGKDEASKGRGIIRDPEIWVRVLHEFIDAAPDAGLEVVDLGISPITGGKGNVEFLGHLRHRDILGGVNTAAAESASASGESEV